MPVVLLEPVPVADALPVPVALLEPVPVADALLVPVALPVLDAVELVVALGRSGRPRVTGSSREHPVTHGRPPASHRALHLTPESNSDEMPSVVTLAYR